MEKESDGQKETGTERHTERATSAASNAIASKQ